MYYRVLFKLIQSVGLNVNNQYISKYPSLSLSGSPIFSSGSQILTRFSSNKAALCHKISDALSVEDVKAKKLKKGEVRYLVLAYLMNSMINRTLLLIDENMSVLLLEIY